MLAITQIGKNRELKREFSFAYISSSTYDFCDTTKTWFLLRQYKNVQKRCFKKPLIRIKRAMNRVRFRFSIIENRKYFPDSNQDSGLVEGLGLGFYFNASLKKSPRFD